MTGTTVDARGQLCPKPVIMTKKALVELPPGQEMIVLLDNETTRDNVFRFLQDNGTQVTCTDDDGVFTIRAWKATGNMAQPQQQNDHQAVVAKPHVIAINNDKMGLGSDELGQILIKAFINTIPEVSPLPNAIVFYNNGIHLAIEGSPVIDTLQELESRGVTVLVCGTCLDYYAKKDRVKAGKVSNLYDILRILTVAGHVIVP